MRKAAIGLLVACSTLVLGLGCGESASDTGSNTNWLQHCDADSDCPEQTECWCHACTTACAAPSDCRSGTCVASAEVGCGVASASSPTVCVEACTGAGDCARWGSGLDCVNGACLPPVSGVGGSGAGNGGVSGAGVGAGAGGAGAFGVAGNGAAGSPAGGNDTGGGGDGGKGAGGGGAESGASDAGGPPVGGTLEPAGERLSVAEMYTCVIANRDATGAPASELWCWGDGPFGGHGSINGETLPVRTPTRLASIADLVGVAVSDEHSCALTAAGEVYCWGRNEVGQLGGPSAPPGTCDTDVDYVNHEYECQPTPMRVEGVSGAVRIAVSPGLSCALLADGSLSCWGEVDAISSWVNSVTDARSLALGPDGICVMTAEKKPACSFPLPISEPVPDLEHIQFASVTGDWVGRFPNRFTIPATLDFGCTLGSDGQVRCFGDNSLGELGDGMSGPGFAPALGNAKQIALGAAHACALGQDERVHCWGRNTGGAVGSPVFTSYSCGDELCETSPREVFGLPPIATLAAGGDRTCALATDDTVRCWGTWVKGNGAGHIRYPGPWDGGAELCQTSMPSPLDDFGLVDRAEHYCLTDSDCGLVPLDLSCAHTCASESVPRAGADAIIQGLADLEANQCASFLSAGCSSPEVSCDPHPTRPVCISNFCVQDDPAHNGCDNRCDCEATRAAVSWTGSNACSGFDLAPAAGVPCGDCQDSTVAVVITNRGDTTFTGEAVLSFESVSAKTDPVAFPAPLTLALDLAPGELSEPIHALSRGPGRAFIKVTAPGDCSQGDDHYWQVAIPWPTNPCD